MLKSHHYDWQTLPDRQSRTVDLVIERGDARHQVRPVKPPVFVVGAADDCDLVLGDQQFPDYYAYIFIRDDTVSLRYLGAPPLITINGRVTRWGEILDGDRIRMGPYELRVRIRDDERTAPRPRRAAPGATIGCGVQPALPILADGWSTSIAGPTSSVASNTWEVVPTAWQDVAEDARRPP